MVLGPAEYLVDLADLLLVLEEDGRIEVGDLAAGGQAHDVVLAGVGVVADLLIKSRLLPLEPSPAIKKAYR